MGDRAECRCDALCCHLRGQRSQQHVGASFDAKGVPVPFGAVRPTVSTPGRLKRASRAFSALLQTRNLQRFVASKPLEVLTEEREAHNTMLPGRQNLVGLCSLYRFRQRTVMSHLKSNSHLALGSSLLEHRALGTLATRRLYQAVLDDVLRYVADRHLPSGADPSVVGRSDSQHRHATLDGRSTSPGTHATSL